MSDEQESLVVAREPGGCGGRVNAQHSVLPAHVARQLDGHLWLPTPPVPREDQSGSSVARTLCDHVCWELIWSEFPEWWEHPQLGAPPPLVLWEAQRVLRDMGFALVLDVQLEVVAGDIAVSVGGAGVLGHLSAAERAEVGELLTTCTTHFEEPYAWVFEELPQPRRRQPSQADLAQYSRPLHPSQPPMPRCPESVAFGGITPASWQTGDWWHTWWSYPPYGVLREGCACSAHTAAARSVTAFGPEGGHP